jgi:UDP-N-acetylglucosamine diphosphorylase/glucosamine-1-phosphate N-acetyltransferase
MTSTSPPLAIVVLAAGKGTRMHSALAKVLHPLAGQPLLIHVLEVALSLSPQRVVVVVGYQAEMVRQVCAPYAVTCVLQEPQLGTGHAVAQAEPILADFQGDVLVLQASTLRTLLDVHQRQQATVTVVTAHLDTPTGYGRIVRDATGRITHIVEERDASEAEKAVREINSGVYCVRSAFLFAALRRVGRHNAQGELYLTDVVALAVAAQHRVAHISVVDAQEVLGVNTHVDLAYLETLLQQRQQG